MSPLDTLNKRLSMWKREKALRGNSRFDVDSAIEGIEDDIKKILDLGIEVSELDQLRAALAQAQAERDAATRRAEQAEAVAARFRDALTDALSMFPDSQNGSDWEYCWQELTDVSQEDVKAKRRAIAAVLAGPEGGPLHGHGAPDADAQGDGR